MDLQDSPSSNLSFLWPDPKALHMVQQSLSHLEYKQISEHNFHEMIFTKYFKNGHIHYRTDSLLIISVITTKHDKK